MFFISKYFLYIYILLLMYQNKCILSKFDIQSRNTHGHFEIINVLKCKFKSTKCEDKNMIPI